MSDRIDVLAVMDAFAADYRAYIPQFHAQNRKRMKVIVADLDEARERIRGEAAVAARLECHDALVQVADQPVRPLPIRSLALVESDDSLLHIHWSSQP